MQEMYISEVLGSPVYAGQTIKNIHLLLPTLHMITFEQFKALDIRIGTIKEVTLIEGADKLLKCMVDTGDETLRQIVSGIREFYPDYEALVGKQVLYVVNLEPRTIRGVESQGMLMAVGDDKPIFLVPETPVTPGSKVR